VGSIKGAFLEAVLLDAEVFFNAIRSAPFAATEQAEENGCSLARMDGRGRGRLPQGRGGSRPFSLPAIPEDLPIR
jgi:hypothetical protein